MIVVTSDHGDYLGDHWLGEKDLFHEQSVKVPLIVYDPSPSADGARGTVCDALVESIDLAATFVEAEDGKVPDHIIEGRSLMPFLRGEAVDDWRDFVISEYDYSASSQAAALGLSPKQARLFMVADKSWKFMHAEGGFRPMLFDLVNDPQELNDLGDDPQYAEIIDVMYERLARWARRASQRTTISDETIMGYRGSSRRSGVLLGLYDGTEVSPDLTEIYRGRAQGRYTGADEDNG